LAVRRAIVLIYATTVMWLCWYPWNVLLLLPLFRTLRIRGSVKPS